MIRRSITTITILFILTIILTSTGCGTDTSARLQLDGSGCKNVGGLKMTEGKSGKTPAFDGKGHIVIPHDPKFHSPTHTITAWLKLKDTQDYQYVLWKAGPEFPEAKNARRMDIWVHVEGNIEGLVDDAKGTDNRTHLKGRTRITDNKWHFIAWVYDGTSARLYVDGVEDAKMALAAPLAKNQFPIWVGARPGDIAATGLIDQLSYFTSAKTRKEVIAMYKAGK